MFTKTLHELFPTFEEFDAVNQRYNLQAAFGYKTAIGAWGDNPVICGGDDPSYWMVEDRIPRGGRESVRVEEIKDEINFRIRNPKTSQVVREALSNLLETILFQTDNYNGFNYVDWLIEGGHDQWVKDGKPEDNSPYLGDKSRVYYI